MVIICLTSGQWKMVEPHLPKEGMCTPLTEDKAFPRLDCREIPDEATYGILRKQGLEAGRDHTRMSLMILRHLCIDGLKKLRIYRPIRSPVTAF
jgi:hypothetical protein